MLEDKRAQRIWAPRGAPTVGTCRLLSFRSPVTQIRCTSQPSAGASPGRRSPGVGGPVLAWCLPCLLLRGPLAEEKSQTLLEPAVPGVRHAVAGSGTASRARGQGRDCSVTGSACRAAGEVLVEPRSEAAPLPRRSSSWCLFTARGGVRGQAWSSPGVGVAGTRMCHVLFPLLDRFEPPSAGCPVASGERGQPGALFLWPWGRAGVV